MAGIIDDDFPQRIEQGKLVLRGIRPAVKTVGQEKSRLNKLLSTVEKQR